MIAKISNCKFDEILRNKIKIVNWIIKINSFFSYKFSSQSNNKK